MERSVRCGLRLSRLGRRVVAPPGARAAVESRAVRRASVRRRRARRHLLPYVVPAAGPTRRHPGQSRLRRALPPARALHVLAAEAARAVVDGLRHRRARLPAVGGDRVISISRTRRDRKSTRLNSSHSQISYAVFCLKKKNKYEKSEILAER